MKIYKNNTNWIIEDCLDESLVSEISDIIKKNLHKLPEYKEGYSTTGKNSHQYWFIDVKNKKQYNTLDFYNFKEKYKKEIFNRLKRSNILANDNIELIDNNCWTVIGEESSYHTVHQHCSGRMDGISTVLYLAVPEHERVFPENNIFLLMNSGINNFFYQNDPGVIHINPEVGKLLIFPNWLYHGTYPQSKGIRQSFNFDYFFGPQKKYKGVENYA